MRAVYEPLISEAVVLQA